MQYKWTALTVTTVGILMTGINSRLLVVGLPVITSSLHADATQAVWFTQSYSLASTIVLLFIGRIGDMYGRIRMYISGFVIFTLGSTLVGLSQSADMLIAFRFLQGIGSAAMMANSSAIITDATPTRGLGTAMGINTLAFRAGSIASLTLSGFILSIALGDWRWLFWINIPIGLFGIVWAKKRLREISRPETNAKMDWYGIATFTTSIVCVMLGLTLAAYGFADYLTSEVLFAISIVCLAVFIVVETRVKYPLLDLAITRIREFTGGTVAALLNNLAFGSSLLIISLYLQIVDGYGALKAGLAILPFDAGFLVLGPLCGRLSDRFGYLKFTTAGLATVSLSLYALSTATFGTPYPLYAVYLVFLGVGIGLFAPPNSASVMGSVPPRRRGVAAGLNQTMMNVGFTISFNLAILIMSFTLPIALISTVISSGGSGVPHSDVLLFAHGISNVYLVMAVIDAVAIIPSIMRGKRVVREITEEDEDDGKEGMVTK